MVGGCLVDVWWTVGGWLVDRRRMVSFLLVVYLSKNVSFYDNTDFNCDFNKR